MIHYVPGCILLTLNIYGTLALVKVPDTVVHVPCLISHNSLSQKLNKPTIIYCIKKIKIPCSCIIFICFHYLINVLLIYLGDMLYSISPIEFVRILFIYLFLLSFCMNFVQRISQKRNQQSSSNLYSVYGIIRNINSDLFSVITQP